MDGAEEQWDFFFLFNCKDPKKEEKTEILSMNGRAGLDRQEQRVIW